MKAPLASQDLGKPRKRRAHPRAILGRLLLALCATMVTLKLGDLLVGAVLKTRTRHLLRLPVNANYRHKTIEFDYQFQTNALGLRGPDRPFTPPNGTSRVAVLGDSFVAGFGVANDDVLTEVMEARLNRRNDAADETSTKKTEVINLGRTGSSTIRETDMYLELGRKFQPKIVVLCYFLGNDLHEIMQEHDAEELARWSPPGRLRSIAYNVFPNFYLELAMLRQASETRAQLAGRDRATLREIAMREAPRFGATPEEVQEQFDRLPEEVVSLLEKGLLHEQRILPACYDPERLGRAIDPTRTYLVVAWERTERHLAMLKREVERDGAKLRLVIFPDAVQVDPVAQDFARSIGYDVAERWLSEIHCVTQLAIRDWCERESVPLLDLTEEFRKSKTPLLYPQDDHFNAAGHRAAGEAIADWISRDNRVKPIP